MKRLFQNKSVGYYLGILAGLGTLILAIVYYVTDFGDKTFSWAAFVLLIAAFCTEVGIVLTNIRFLPILPPILVGGAVGMHLYTAFPSITDLINGIVFIGGNSKLAVQLAIAFGIAGLVFVIAGFFEKNR